MPQSANLEEKNIGILALAKKLDEIWSNLCAEHLPYISEKTIWRYNRPAHPNAPKQGWKIHVSATILNAVDVLQAVAPFLNDLKIQFKAPSSLFELMKLNAGIFYGYSQIGKFITVYPTSDEEFVFLAKNLHRLTKRYKAPAVPFDFRLKKTSNIFYRFGVFRQSQISNGAETLSLTAQNGEGVSDSYEATNNLPEWMKIHFKPGKSNSPAKKNPLQTTYNVFRALSQRGKGGVYLAFNGEVAGSRLCVLKEGRKNGETGWDGLDGFHRVKNEKRVLKNLLRKQIAVPQIIDSFQLENNFYLVTAFVGGTSLREIINRAKPSVSRAVACGFQIAELLAQIHNAGWVWRDCKPENIIVSERKFLTALDFEGACRIGYPQPLFWTTPEYTPPEVLEKAYQKADFAEDLYAFGKILFLLLEGNLSERNLKLPVKRSTAHMQIEQIINELLDPIPANRPSAERAAQALKKFVS